MRPDIDALLYKMHLATDSDDINLMLLYIHITTPTHTGQLITQPPESTTAALGTNATFSCHGSGDIIWEIDGTHVFTKLLVQLFADFGVYVPLPTPSVSELIMTATEINNFTRSIICQVDPGIGVGEVEESAPVHLTVFCEYRSIFTMILLLTFLACY